MVNKRRLKILMGIVLGIILIVMADYLIHNMERDLIRIEEVNRIGIERQLEDGSHLKIDAADNATDVDYKNKVYIVDNDALLARLSQYKSKLSRNSYFPRHIEADAITFTIMQNNKPRHFILGDMNIWYAGDGPIFEIIEGERLEEELLDLILEQ